MPSHVLLIHQNFVSGRQAGNARAIHMVAEILRRGFHVDVITGYSSYLEEGAEANSDVLTEQEGGLTIVRVETGGGKSSLFHRGRSYLRFLAKAFRCLRTFPKTEVVYATSPPLPQLLLSMAVSCWRGAPMVLEIRDLWPRALVDVGLLRSRLLIKLLEWIEAVAYRYCDHCVPVSPPFVEYLRAMGVRPVDMTVIPSGGDPDYIEADHEESCRWCHQRGLDGKFLVVYCGSFNEHYGIDCIVETAVELAPSRPDIHWVFAGNGRHREKIEQFVSQHESIHYLGQLPRDEIRYLLWSANIAIVSMIPCPHMETVIPGKIMDYLAAGLPILSTADGQTGEIVRAANAGIVCTLESEHIRQAVQQLADMPEADRLALGRQGQRWVSTHMNTAQMADVFADVVEKAACKPYRNRLVRLSLALLGASVDVFLSRSRRAEQSMFGLTGRQSMKSIFQEWLQEDRKLQTTESRIEGQGMPSLLSKHA